MSESKPKGGDAGALDRLLRLFADVRAGESVTALLLLANLFLILVGYYVLKTVREPLILATGGAEVKSYAAAGQALTLMALIPLYGWFSARVNRLRLISGLTLFFIACIEIFFVAGQAKVPYLGVIFYIWVGIFSLASISQFWSYANDLYDRPTGNRLFAMIGIGATVGSWAGSKIAEVLFEGHMSPYAMMQVTAAMLCASLALYWLVEAREGGRRARGRETLSAEGGFRLVLSSKYLRLIGLLLILLNLVNTTGEYILSRSVVAEAARQAASNPSFNAESYIGAFYGQYFFYVNLAAVVIQAFIVSRVVQYLGMPGALLALPLVSLGAYGSIAAGVGFAAIRWAKTAENSADYSIMNTARQMLWLPTNRDEKYKAKQTLDTFFVRAGDVLAAGLVFAGTHWLILGVAGFALTNLLLIALWLSVAVLLLREYRRLTRS